jgi:hypothetical protein
MVDCMLSGVHGAASVRGLMIERPDISIRGIPVIGTAEDVLRNWTAS